MVSAAGPGRARGQPTGSGLHLGPRSVLGQTTFRELSLGNVASAASGPGRHRAQRHPCRPRMRARPFCWEKVEPFLLAENPGPHP